MTMPVTTPIPNAIENILIQNVEAEIPGPGAQAICSAKGQACVDRASQATSGNWPQQSEHIAAVGEPAMSTATINDGSVETYEGLTEALVDRLSHPATSPDVDLKKGVNEVLVDVDMTTDDCGGNLSFYGRDPILQSPLRFGTM